MDTENNAQRLVCLRLPRNCADIFRYTKACYTRRTEHSPSEHSDDLPRSVTIQRFAFGGHNSGQKGVERSSIPHSPPSLFRHPIILLFRQKPAQASPLRSEPSRAFALQSKIIGTPLLPIG